MKLEPADPSKFIGLMTTWGAFGLEIAPSLPDPWCAAFYDDKDNLPLKPWLFLSPLSQKRAVTRTLLCRALQ